MRPYNGIILKDNMSRRNLNGCHIRKLIRAGRGKSICITIPIEYIRDLNWKEHQEVIIERKKDTILIKDWTSQGLPFGEDSK